MRVRRLGALPVCLAVIATMTTPASSEIGPQAVACAVDYSASNWGGGGGFTANLHVTNLGDPVNGWTLSFVYPGDQRLTPPGWSATWSQAAGSASVSATNLDWNRSLATGQAFDMGFNGTFTGTNAAPTSFSLNNTVCTGAPPPTTTTTSSTTSSTTSTTTPPPPGKVDNPYVGAKGYVNPDWSALAAGEPGGSRVANQPTAVWLDRIAAITGTSTSRGLVGHLDEAVRQAAGQPLVIELVIYDLPGRDCAALASNGELGPTDIGRYEHEYIDVIAGILARPAYKGPRILTIVEPDSLPNMVTNADGQNGATPQCATMKQNGNYVTGVGYALHTLNAVGNVYNYIDAGRSEERRVGKECRSR